MYLKLNFPELDYIVSARVCGEGPTPEMRRILPMNMAFLAACGGEVNNPEAFAHL